MLLFSLIKKNNKDAFALQKEVGQILLFDIMHVMQKETSLKEEFFSLDSFLDHFADRKGVEKLEVFRNREAKLETSGKVGRDGLREDLPEGTIFLYSAPIEKLSHMGGFPHKMLDPWQQEKIWIFVGKDNILFALSADALERTLGGNYHLLLPGEEGYLAEGQKKAIRKAQEYQKMPVSSRVTIDGISWQKRYIKKEIPLLYPDRSSRYSFGQKGDLALWVSENRTVTSEQLAGLKTSQGHLVSEYFSLERYLKKRTSGIFGD